MKASDKYKKIFGEIKSLAEDLPWSTGVSNMLEWLTWNTSGVLGISKTKYWKLVVELSHDPQVREGTLKDKEIFVEQSLKKLIQSADSFDRYEKPSSSIASPREALRRAKYFSEDYLNKEFDIFWGLVSDNYLDQYYGQYFHFDSGGKWYCHGNSELFASCTNINEMQMDNLSYNPDRGILVANELKLGGKKNKDQILKYALMYRRLLEKGFISENTNFVIFFIGDDAGSHNWIDLIEDEVEYCRSSNKSNLHKVASEECLEIATKTTFVSTGWGELYDFNKEYTLGLSPSTQQVERKLLWGFNESLSVKAFFKK